MAVNAELLSVSHESLTGAGKFLSEALLFMKKRTSGPLKERTVEISKAQNEAAGEMIDLVAGRVGSNRAVHPETAIACAARLAGSLMLRSFDFKLEELKPGVVILSNEANERVPQLIGIMSAVLQGFSVSLDHEKLGGEPAQRGAAPQLTVVQSLALLQEDALRITSEHGLGLEEAAQAGAVATAFIVKECATNIGGEVGFNVAAYGFIEGCKTVPPALGPAQKSAGEKKPWYKLW
jgi:hypothetical protein